MTTEAEQKQENDYVLLRRVEQCSLLLIALLVLGGGYCFGSQFAFSAVTGGILSLGSFLMLKKTVLEIVSRIDTQQPTAGFAGKFYLRLLVLVLLLAALSLSIKVHLLGLLAGLSTVMVSVITVVLGRGLTDFLEKRAKGA